MVYLVLVRHGESVWNAKGLWTGLVDVSLSEKGKEEAVLAAKALQNIKFNVGFTSTLKRSIETIEEIKNRLQEEFPIYQNKALNERDYGEMTGKNKWEIKKKLGKEEFLKIRRAWNYPIKGGETLKDVYDRVVPYYRKQILPELKAGKNVLVVAHGNSLRALVKYLDKIKDIDIPKLEIATGEIDVYKIDKNGNILSKEVKGC